MDEILVQILAHKDKKRKGKNYQTLLDEVYEDELFTNRCNVDEEAELADFIPAGCQGTRCWEVGCYGFA